MAVRLITLVREEPAEFSVDSAHHTIYSLNSEGPRLSAGLMSTARMPTCSLKPFGPSSCESSAHLGSFPITHIRDFLDYYARSLSRRPLAGLTSSMWSELIAQPSVPLPAGRMRDLPG